MSVKRIRWECPAGKHPGVLGPSRPRRDNIVRYCLPCSEAAGKLVERVAPALERKRTTVAQRRDAQARTRLGRERAGLAQRYKVEVLDYDEGTTVVDARDLLVRAWNSKELREARVENWGPGRVFPPDLTIRRSDGSTKWRTRRPRGRASGHSKYGCGSIVLTVGPGLGREWLEAIIIHEAVHSALPSGDWHRPLWRSTYLRTVSEVYGLPMGVVKNEGQASWKLDEQIATAIKEAGRA